MTDWMQVTDEDVTAEFGNPAYPDLPTEPGMWSVVGLWRVTARIEGEISRTQFVRYLWAPLGSRVPTFEAHGETWVIAAVSTTDAIKWAKDAKMTMINNRVPVYLQIGDTRVGRCTNPACQATGWITNFERDGECYICHSPHR